MIDKKRNTGRKKSSILDAAAQAFMQDGYDNTSMDRIAELAGASKRTVYNHFPSKEVLFQAVLSRFLAEVIALNRIKYDPDQSLESQLEEFADAKLEIPRNPSWLGLMKVTAGIVITNPALAMETIQQAEDADDALGEWLKAAVADGRMKVADIALATEAFWAMVRGAFFWPSIFLGPMEDAAAEAMKKELVAIFLARYRV